MKPDGTGEPSAVEHRVLLVPPTRRDGEVTSSLLASAQIECVVCKDLSDLAGHVEHGVGSIMLTDRALFDPAMEDVVSRLRAQPAWSDVPVLVLLTRDHQYAAGSTQILSRLTNVTVLDRPVSTRSLLSAVSAALRGRQRQYQLRTQLQAQAAVEEALRDGDRKKDEFLATLAHELRNPLAPLRNGLQLLNAAKVSPDQGMRVRQMMGRQLDHLIKLIDELLDVSRIATGKVVLRKAVIDMRRVVHGAMESCQPSIDQAQHQVSLRLPPQPVWVVGDASRLEQVVANLLNNACKYTTNGGSITVTLSEESQQAVVRVVDNGVGIPFDMLPFVFDLFTQVSRNLDRSQGGLGIGLSLARRLMDLHGGDISADSAGPGHGSQFTIRLASVPAPADAESTAPQAPPAASRSLRVLVVDDNADAANSLSSLIEHGGHETLTVYGGAAALEAAEKFMPEAIFCDIGMPGIDGHTVARRLRTSSGSAGTVLVAVTGWSGEQYRCETRRSGFDYHLAKPVSWTDVAGILAAIARSDVDSKPARWR